MEEFHYDSIFYIGDFNADPFSGRFWHHLNAFMNNNDLLCYDFKNLNSDSYTYIGHGNFSCWWLDHVVGRVCGENIVGGFKILDDVVGSDHLPLVFEINVKYKKRVTGVGINEETFINFVEWDKISKAEAEYLAEELSKGLGVFPDCAGHGCRDEQNTTLIYNFYEGLK